MIHLLKKHFGYDTFRPKQAEIIQHVMSGSDALVLMPTGGGKSLCYQLPALKFPGTTVVVSPLIALMKDQVDALTANGISAAFLNSSLSAQEMVSVERDVRNGKMKLLYLAPERLAMPAIRQFLKEVSVSLFAIDEAHCISEWGHDFRPDYRTLRDIRTLFPGIPMLALTATANERVRNDIIAQLSLRDGKIFRSSFNRSNLTYRVIPKKKALERLVQELKARPNESAIIYCFSRKGTEKTAADLKANGIKAAAYHAGLSPIQRTRVQERFIRDETPVITATIAFGMGINKPDVRLVVHRDMPKSVEGYYQETGRAGRDGLPSDCLLFFSQGDRFKHEFFIRDMDDLNERQKARKQLDDMARYCTLTSCRRTYLLHYFGEAREDAPCLGCDICLPKQTLPTPSKRSLLDFDSELFEKLRGIRKRLAEERGVPPYIVFGDKTLQDMARYFPQHRDSFSNISGVGAEKLTLYFEPFVEEIQKYAQKEGIKEREIPTKIRRESTKKTARAVSQTILMSIKFFAEKRTPKQIAAVRGLSEGTILQHLEQAMDQKKLPNADHVYFSDEERFARIERAFTQAGTTMLTPIRAKLGEEFTYDEIRLARFILQAREYQKHEN